ncbi:phage tail tape measure protein [Hominifimenecus sp. rT4P-3]|uniref:phage tail tape measure protein n=1 Tax=Hominifimenecus sp. rT4P-3 TaxID=3242979 RepID=UPI003DA47E79
MADGEIQYTVRVDDSKLNGDLQRVGQAVKKSAKETGQEREKLEKKTSDAIKQEQKSVTEHQEKQNDERVKDDKETGQEREKNEKTVAENAKKIIKKQLEDTSVGSIIKWTDGLSGAKAAAVGVGVGIAEIGIKAVGAADEMKQAMNGYLASTGKGKEETERYQKVLEEIYTNNYGESFKDIAQAMAQVDKQLGDMSDEELQQVTESAFVLKDVFKYDVSESTRAAKALMDNFGVSGEEAMGLIAVGAQNGLDYSGELLDSINKYSSQFAKVGLDADDMFKIFETGAETGAWNLDKIGDAVKEMSIRVIDGSDTTKEGFEAIGLDADIMAEKFAAGGDTAKEAFEQTIEALAEMEDPLEQNAAGAALFGSAWEELGPEVISQLADIEEGAYNTGDALNQMKDVNGDDLKDMIGGLQRNLEMLLIPLGEMLMPILENLIQSVLPVLMERLGPLMDAFMTAIGPIVSLISEAIQPLIDILAFLLDFTIQPLIEIMQSLPNIFNNALNGVLEKARPIIENIKGIFGGIIDFIEGIFTGDWGRAWEGVKSIFSNIVDGIGNIWKTPINFCIDVLNGFIRGLNKIQVPDWVPGIGGMGFHISEIKRLKKGMAFVPSDDYLAFLHYGERVLTKEENAAFMAAGGLSGLEHGEPFHSAAGKEARFDIYLQLDGRTVARQTARYTGEQLSWEEI